MASIDVKSGSQIWQILSQLGFQLKFSWQIAVQHLRTALVQITNLRAATIRGLFLPRTATHFHYHIFRRPPVGKLGSSWHTRGRVLTVWIAAVTGKLVFFFYVDTLHCSNKAQISAGIWILNSLALDLFWLDPDPWKSCGSLQTQSKIEIWVMAKSYGLDNLILHLWMPYSLGCSFKAADF
jgi:hypothetical protein